MADKTTNDSTNNNEKNSGKKIISSIAGGLVGFFKKHLIIALALLALIIIIIVSLLDYETKKRNAKEDPSDPKNGPAAASEFTNNVYIDEEGKLRTEKSITELWQELKEKGNKITSYLGSSSELAKLLSASMATDYPDIRNNPDEPIDWSKYDLNVDSTEVQGIVKFKRALTSGETITMKYIPSSEFQKKMNQYNRTGNAKDRDEALKYFTLERSVATSNNGLGVTNVGTRPFNNDTFDVEDNIDVYDITNRLYGNTYDAVQGCCFDGKYIICSGNKGKHGKHGGSVFWIDAETKKRESDRVDIGSEGTHMEGMTYDSARKVILCVVTGKRLLQINNETRTKMGYINIPRHFRQLAYSVTTQELIGFDSSKKTVTFMKYNGNEYGNPRTVKLNNASFNNIQGISSDGQVIFLADSRPETSSSKYRVWVYDFNGNKVEEHKMGSGFKRGIEVENSYADKDGNLWLVMPHEVVKVKGYKAHAVDWANNYSAVPTTGNSLTSGNSQTNGNAKLSEILEYACQWVGKIKYETGHYGELREGGKASCSGFVYGVFIHFGIDTKKKTAKHWDEVPGMEEIGNDLSKASPGDILWTKGSSDCHVAIYLGNKKRIHSTPGHNGVSIAKASTPHKIYHVKALPKDPGAYFDPETGEYHGTLNNTNATSTTSSSSTTSPTTSSTVSTAAASTSSTTSSINNSSSSNNIASGFEIVKEAEKYVGKIPYKKGHHSLDAKEGADSSGFVWAVLNRLKLINWGYTNDAGFRNKGKEVHDISNAQPGDVICFNGHIAIYKGKVNGEGYMIESLNEKTGVINTRKVSDEKRAIITIRRFTDNSTGTTAAMTSLGPVETDEIFGQFSEETKQIILAHRNDFNKHNYKEFINSYPGGYEGYLQSLGGVFAKYGGKAKDVKATDAGTFQEIAEYTWGLFAIWGFDYWNGSTYCSWGKDNSEVAQSAYYPSHRLEADHYSTGHIDDICSNPKKHMRTNCNYGSNSFLTKAGLTDDNNFTTHYKRGQKIENPEDFQIGDLVHFFGSDGRWHHVAVVGEMDPNLGPILYDSGNRFIRSGNYKFPLSSKKYKNYSYWICRRYFDIDQSTSGQIGTGVASGNGTKYVYKVKVATWQENIETVSSSDSSENKNERNFSMNPKTIPYQDIVAQYRMPFNYLWTMLIYSNDKNYVFELANLVRNSQIEITIHDNLNENKTTVKENITREYHYSGQADIKMDYTGNLTVSDPNNPQDTGQATIPVHDSITKTGNGTLDYTDHYNKTTVNIDKVNTLDVALTLADAWCVKYEKKYKFNGTKDTPGTPSSNKTVDNIEGEDESSITNSTLLSRIKSDARAKASGVLNSMSASITNNGGEVVAGTASQSTDCKVTTVVTTTVDTKETSYTGEPEKFYTDEISKFGDLLNRSSTARRNITTGQGAWLFEALESNADTANMVDLTKYLLYKATGTSYGVTTFDFKVFNMQNVGSEYSGSMLNMTSTTLSKDQFIQKTQSYSAALANGPATKTFRDNAGVVYDVCVKNNVNPVLCAAQGWAEQNWVAPGTSPYNYWGIAVYNGQNYGSSYSGMEAAVENYCKNINQRMKGENGALTWSKSNAKYNNKFTGSMSTLYDILSNWACADDYATNPANQAKHAADYVDKIISIAKTIYGEGALSTQMGTSSVVEFAMKYKGKRASEFGLFNYQSKNGATDRWFADEWCAMFVSFCFDNCGLIPNQLKDSYSLCSDGWNNLGNRQENSAARGGNYQPKAGDIIFFGSNAGQHTGIVVKSDGSKVYTIEGNTSGSNFNNSIVSEVSYSLNNSWIWGYGRMSN